MLVRRIPQRKIINIILILCGIAFIYFGLVFYQQTARLIKANQWVQHTYRVIGICDEILYNLSLASSKERGYLLTGNPEFKNLYLQAVETIQQDLALLKVLTKDNPKQQNRLKSFTISLNVRLEFLENITNIFEKHGLTAAIKNLNLNQELFAFNDTFFIATQVMDDEKKLLKERSEQFLEDSYHVSHLALLGFIFTLIVFIACFIILNQQLTLREKAEKKLFRIAYFNPLTKLPNRVFLLKKLTDEIELAKKANKNISLLYLNLDNFKNVNDSFGYEIGDEVLKLTALRLKNKLPTKHVLTHMGGNEFVILLFDIFDVLPIVTKTLLLIEEPFQLGNQKIKLSTSIGIAVFPSNGLDANTLLKNANIAMYIAKDKGKNTYQFCNPELTTEVEERALLGYYLQQAIVRDELSVFYQPKISLSTEQLVGVEALMRWQRSDGSFIYPESFIPLAEDNALITALGEWSLRTVCRQIKKWQNAGLAIKNVAVNISPLQVNNKNFVEKVQEILQETDVDPKVLELEITESALLKNIESNVLTLSNLKKLGVQLTIDDFGTGFSSLGYCRSFPIDKVKIDQSFLKEITATNHESIIIRSIITMAHDLGLKVVAEGVETAIQVEVLKRYNCDEAQGFFYSKAVSSTEAAHFFSGKK